MSETREEIKAAPRFTTDSETADHRYLSAVGTAASPSAAPSHPDPKQQGNSPAPRRRQQPPGQNMAVLSRR
ncbi:hypothetical protein DEJ46_20775 [Streptomyces venezuelae]|uniref:Uncharacterized protein n=1 Tax=Streptomyces venezuelae TaxID=54571 RepID=A0A5P2AUE8_STRVZ|nr:hypothetical protein DEJ46_20775 [Streptomyces venezuelae]